jgi:hypothetical protein
MTTILFLAERMTLRARFSLSNTEWNVIHRRTGIITLTYSRFEQLHSTEFLLPTDTIG